MQKIKLLIFDVGGVFRDSSRAMGEGFRRGFVSCALKYNFNAQDVWHLRGIGKYNNSGNCAKALFALSKADESLSKVIAKPNAESLLDGIVNKNTAAGDEETINKIRSGYKDFFYSESAGKLIKLYPKVAEAINALHGKGYKLAIFTNAKISSVKRDLGNVDLNKFSLVVSEEDLKNKKPSGEGILKICSGLRIAPAETAYVGDCVVDILAAKNAGCKSVALLCGMGLKNHLKRETPNFIFENLWKMSRRFSG